MPRRGNYTEQEVAFLRENYLRLSYKEIAVAIGRSLKSVQHKINKLGLEKNPLKRWTPEDDDYLVQGHASGKQLADVARELNRDQSDVSEHAKKLGITKWRVFKVYVNSHGYRVVGYYWPPGAKYRRAILEHRRVYEAFVGRELESHELIHHINGDKLDNRIENLQLMPSVSAHRMAHASVEWHLPLLCKAGLLSYNADKREYEPTQKLLDMQPTSETS